LYEARPDVGSIVHTHSHHVTVLSTTGQFVGMYSPAAVIFAGEQAHYVDDGFGPSVEGKAMAAALGDRSVLLMKNHGALIASATLESATVEAMALEQCARVHLAAVAAGGTEIAPAEVAQSRRAYDRHFRAMTWEANLRRLRRSDPDLFAAIEGDDDGSQHVSGAS
jgi:L-fuculose-phosphate aldolase